MADKKGRVVIVALNSYINWLFVGRESGNGETLVLTECRNVRRHTPDRSPLDLAGDESMAISMSSPHTLEVDRLSVLWLAPAEPTAWLALYPR